MVKITFENITQAEFLEILSCTQYPELGATINLPCEVAAVNVTQDGSKFMDNQVFNILVELTRDVAIGLFTSYLYDKFVKLREQNKTEPKLKIDDKETAINETAIQINISKCENVIINNYTKGGENGLR